MQLKRSRDRPFLVRRPRRETHREVWEEAERQRGLETSGEQPGAASRRLEGQRSAEAPRRADRRGRPLAAMTTGRQLSRGSSPISVA